MTTAATRISGSSLESSRAAWSNQHQSTHAWVLAV